MIKERLLGYKPGIGIGGNPLCLHELGLSDKLALSHQLQSTVT